MSAAITAVEKLKGVADEAFRLYMVLTYGRWQGNIPGETGIHIVANTVVSNYDLPTLFWSNDKQRYVAQEE